MMQDQDRVKALYSVLTGQPYAEGNSLLLDIRDLWNSADILFRFFAPTDAHIGALLLYKFGGAQPEKAVPGHAMAEEEKSLVQSVAEASNNGADGARKSLNAETAATRARMEKSPEVPILEVGDIPWRVEIDGIPVTWRLLYSQAHLPVTRGKLCRFGGNLYRVSKVYGTMLYLTSQESEVCDMNYAEVMA